MGALIGARLSLPSDVLIYRMSLKVVHKITLMACMGEEQLAQMGQDNCNGALPPKRFAVELNPEGSRVVSWKKLLKGRNEKDDDDDDSDDSELMEKEWSQYRMQYRVHDSDSYELEKSAADGTSAGAPGVVDKPAMKESDDPVAETTMQNREDEYDGDSSDYDVWESEESGGGVGASASDAEKAMKELTDALAKNPKPIVRQYGGEDDRQRVRQYLPHEVKVKLEGATMLHLQENRNFSNEFMDRLKSLLGGMMKPRTLEAYLKRRLQDFNGN